MALRLNPSHSSPPRPACYPAPPRRRQTAPPHPRPPAAVAHAGDARAASGRERQHRAPDDGRRGGSLLHRRRRLLQVRGCAVRRGRYGLRWVGQPCPGPSHAACCSHPREHTSQPASLRGGELVAPRRRTRLASRPPGPPFSPPSDVHLGLDAPHTPAHPHAPLCAASLWQDTPRLEEASAQTCSWTRARRRQQRWQRTPW